MSPFNDRPFSYLTPRRVEFLERLSRLRSQAGLQMEGPDKRTALELARMGLVTMNREQTHTRIEADGRRTLQAFKKAQPDEAPAVMTKRRSPRP